MSDSAEIFKDEPPLTKEARLRREEEADAWMLLLKKEEFCRIVVNWLRKTGHLEAFCKDTGWLISK